MECQDSSMLISRDERDIKNDGYYPYDKAYYNGESHLASGGNVTSTDFPLCLTSSSLHSSYLSGEGSTYLPGGAKLQSVTYPEEWKNQISTGAYSAVISGPAQVTVQRVTKKPRDYLVESSLAFICCCWPLSALAIYYTLQAMTLSAQGKTEAAIQSSNNARDSLIASLVIGIILVASGLVIYYFGYASKNSESSNHH